MSAVSLSGIGAEIKTSAVTKNATSETIVSAAIDRTDFESCKLHTVCGAASGTPSAQTVDSKITHCDTSGGSYTDYTPPSGTAATTQLTADSTESMKSIDLSKAKQYIKTSTTVALTAGTSPRLAVATTLVLGGARNKPAQTDV